MDSWHKELAELNNKKVEGQYKYPDSFIRFCSTIKATLGIGYRQISGFTGKLKHLVNLSNAPKLFSISAGSNQLGIDLVDSQVDTKDRLLPLVLQESNFFNPENGFLN